MMHEHTVTKLYTPVRLGEILTTRSFTSSGQVNQLATKDRDKEKSLGLDDSGNLAERVTPPWDPRSILAILDGLEAVKWAFIFCNFADEPTASRWTDYFVKLARNRQQELHLVKSIWDSASWTVALAMRINKTFKEATEELLANQQWFSDAFNQYQPSTPSPKKKPRVLENSPFPRRYSGALSDATSKRKGKDKTRERPQQPYSSKSAPKGQGKGKGKDPSAGGKTPNASNDICRNFNAGRCTQNPCPRKHACSKCGKPNHSAMDCWAGQ